MTQTDIETKAPRGRGRPPAFSRDEVLDLAIMEFRRSGYDGATMDRLAECMGITKPSIYRAFGDRKSLYRAALEKYGANISAYWHESSEKIETLDEFTNTFLIDAVNWFIRDLDGKAGCLILSTMSHASVDEELMNDLRAMISSMENEVEEYILSRGFLEGEEVSNARSIAMLLTSYSHSLGTRARAGVTPEVLRSEAVIMAKSIMSLVSCASGKS